MNEELAMVSQEMIEEVVVDLLVDDAGVVPELTDAAIELVETFDSSDITEVEE